MHNFDAEREIISGQIRSRIREIEALIYRDRQPIGGLEVCVTGPGRGPERAPSHGWRSFETHERWGGFDQTTWFRMTVCVPQTMAGQAVVALIRPGGESLAYVNGAPFQGLDSRRDELFLLASAKGGETFTIELESVPSVRSDEYHHFEYADLAALDNASWDAYWDFRVILDAAQALPADSVLYRRLLELLDRSVKTVDLQHKGTPRYADSLTKARDMLRDGLKQFANEGDAGRLVLVGQSHIDTAWLWPLRETRRKCGRTFATVLRLMERYPEFSFMVSQPAQLEWIREQYPETFARIKERVREGRWEPIGGMYVEADCNVPSGDSFVRQFLFGNRFFRKEFGVHTRTAWLPDTFGDSWALPQILRKAQIDTFVTTKINWCEFTRFPHDFFEWEGPDGTRVSCLIPPLNYDAQVRFPELMNQWDLFQQKDRVDRLPFTYGFGDGGGGPTPAMIETGKRLANLAGVPRCVFGRMQDCLDEMHRQCRPGALPVWNGELYLELHRGCLTTQARTKRNNRKCEFLLRDAEFLNTLALAHGGVYDKDNIDAAWKLVLLNQFHDILPGSSITEVYEVAERDYAEARRRLEGAQTQAVEYLLSRIDTAGEGMPVVVFNTLPWVRTDVAAYPGPLPEEDLHVVSARGEPVPSQRTTDGKLIFLAEGLPPMGYAAYRILPGKGRRADVDRSVSARLFSMHANGGRGARTGAVLENGFVRMTVDACGRLTGLYDKCAGREVLASGERGNVLQLFEDRPRANDAWDIDFNFDENRWEPGPAETCELAECGPVRSVLRVVRRTERSAIRQDIVLYAHTARADFVTHVDWKDRRTLLKAAFPVAVRSTRAAYEIQFAVIERATHSNTAFDRARFEVTGHKWADLSEGDYGVSLLNDCKYGYDIKGNVMRLSLLRSPESPDPHADEGNHEFTYAIYHHARSWRNGTVREGFELNVPLLVYSASPHTGPLPAAYAFAAVDAENVILHTVKRCEDSEDVIVRVYEAYGQRSRAMLTFDNAPVAAWECDLMEENDTAVEVRGNSVFFYITPFEIRTFKIRF